MSNKDLDHFNSISWCSELLNDPNTVIVDKSVRDDRREALGGNMGLFIAETLATERTIRADITFYRLPLDEGRFPVRTLCVLYDIGQGVNSWTTVAHGGLVATLLDETSGRLLQMNTHLALENGIIKRWTFWVTMSMKLAYKKPVSVGKVSLVTAKLVEAEGKKCVVTASVKDEHGTVLCSSESMFVEQEVKPML